MIYLKNNDKNLTIRRDIKDAIFIFFGVTMASVGLKGFLLPNDFLDGGAGDDIYVFSSGWGNDRIIGRPNGNEKDVIEFMRKNSQPSSFKMWRKRMASRKTKHLKLREQSTIRFKCNRQRGTGNKISKR
jgi:uncharacterized protein (TIGR03643 family)